ncbi:MAG: YciI family protein [Methyloceanibacter sp.]
MLYALICTDKPNSLAIRKAKRPEHVEYLESLGDALVIAGPFTEADGETMNGSLIVIEAASLQAAEKIAAGDPFAKAGLFASVEIRPWLWTFNSPADEDE